MSSTANFLAVDLGASTGRVVWGRWDGQGFKLQDLHRFPNNPLRSEGRLQWDIEQLWREIKKGLALYPTLCQELLTSIGVATWAVDYALLDENDQLLGLPYHYRDHRTDGLMAQVLEKVPRARIFDETGLQFLPFNTLYQLYSQTETESSLLAQATTFLMIPDLLHFWLCGRKAVEFTNATTTQFFSVKEKDWAKGLLAELGIPTHYLPPIVQPGTILGELRLELAKEVGLTQEIPVRIVTPGTHDTASAVAGIPYLDKHTAFLSSGTWSLVGVELDNPILSPSALALNFTNEGGVAGTTRLLKNVMGLWLVQECQRIWQEAGHYYDWETLAQMSEQTPAFASLIDPDTSDFLNPVNMPEAIQNFCHRTGQPIPQSPGAIIRCCLESLALKYRVVMGQLEELLDYPLKVIRVVGGGSQNELLGQFTASACDREVITGPVEATALGNILLQAIATGHISDLTAGRKALENGFSLKHYFPKDRPAWAEALVRFQRLA
jgi:rhamnulokinase